MDCFVGRLLQFKGIGVRKGMRFRDTHKEEYDPLPLFRDEQEV